MSAIHAAQVNFLAPPVELTNNEVLEHWPSLVDIAEVAASGGTRVSVVQAAASDERFTRNDIEYHFVDVSGLSRARDRGRRLADALAEIRPNVMHANGLGFAQDAFAISQCLPQLPIIFQDHADRPPPWWRRTQWRRWYARIAGVAFTAIEQAHAFNAGGLFGPTVRVFVIPESSSRFTPGSRVHARAETGLHGDPCVLWIGHLNAGKDPLTVLDGVALAASRLLGLQLWCVFGNAPLLDDVQQRIDHDPQFGGRVHLLGKAPHAQVEVLMRCADLFVSGSHHEGSGYSLLESLACGVAPVVTDIPPFRALTGNGSVGHLWPCGDAARLAEALIDASVNRASTERVRAHFDATLSFSAVGRQWADAYAQVCEDQRRSRA